MALTSDVKKKAVEAGFISVGVSNPDMLKGSPYGWVGQIVNLRSPVELMSNVKSVIVMAFSAWDKAFNLSVDSPKWLGYGMHAPDEQFESYYLSSEIMRNKAWSIVDYLQKRGFDSVIAAGMPLKTSAVKCGLGCQGKNTLLITPELGPRVRLISVLTAAELDVDEPYKQNLCGDCEQCLSACPTKALEPYGLKISRCMTYSAESPCSTDVPQDVRELEKKLIQRPTSHSYIECTMCIDACPVGKPNIQNRFRS